MLLGKGADLQVDSTGFDLGAPAACLRCTLPPLLGTTVPQKTTFPDTCWATGLVRDNAQNPASAAAPLTLPQAEAVSSVRMNQVINKPSRASRQ